MNAWSWNRTLCVVIFFALAGAYSAHLHGKIDTLQSKNIQLLKEQIQLQEFCKQIGIASLDRQGPVKLLNSLPYPDKVGKTKTYFIHSALRDQADTPVPVNQLFLEDIKTGELLRVFSNDVTLSQRVLELSRFEEGGVAGTSYKILDEVETRALFQKLGKRYVP